MSACRRKAGRVRQLRHHAAAGRRPPKIAMRRLPCVILPLGIAKRHLRIARPRAAGRDERFNQVGPRLGRDQRISVLLREVRSLDATSGHCHGRLGVRSIEQSRMIQPEVFAPVVDQIAPQQPLDDVDRFREALVPLGRPRPPCA
jgi:hypothetical protein